MRSTDSETVKQYTDRGWWGDTTFASLIADAVNDAPDRLALIDPPNRKDLVAGAPCRLTYAQVSRLADRLASTLSENGVGTGDVIIVQLPNIAELVIAYIATDRLGAIISPMPMQYGRFELARAAEVTKARAYLTVTAFRGVDHLADRTAAFGADTTILAFEDNSQTKGTHVALLFFPTIDADEDVPTVTRPDISPNEIFTICWTSGTTGVPKGVPRHHNHWTSQVGAVADAAPVRDGAVMLNPFPLTNMGAISGFLYYWPMAKACLVMHHPFDLQVFLSQIVAEKVAYTIAPPAVLNMFLQHTELHKTVDLSHVDYIASGSAPLSPSMTKGFKDLFDVEIVNFYGSNEGAGLVGGPSDIPDPEVRATLFPRFGRPEINWSNRFANRCRTKLVDWQADDREITEPGIAGELLITGPNVFDGYLGDAAKTEGVFDNEGYFRTGDLFEIGGEDNRFYRFVGRRKELIIRGGMNISPEELDHVITDHPLVSEAAVVGFSDRVMGEKVAAVVVTNAGETLTLAELTSYLAECGVAKFKWPEQLVLGDTLPRNSMNKVIRSELRGLL
ncbi:class I adenylate-forming enzyme family protein [Kordiimonas sp.]|uniref:class I adenylate-forming enzyme family protein n=1 Tax=Kordiimonas sp. TaxID=1970157 RepID=UPI003A91BE1A